MLEGEAEAPELAQAAPSPEGPADEAEAPAPSSSNSSGAQGGSAQTASAAAAPEPVATSSGQPSSSGPSSPHSPAAEETRICFPFLNRGVCSFGAGCRFRHLAPDHPDAIADRVRTGHIFKIANVQDEKVQAQLQELTAATSPSAQALAPPTAASHDARICFPFLNHGRCDREATCRFRHLAPDHPDAVADRMRTGAYDKIPPHANPLIEQNPHVTPGEARICYSFLNRGTCDRPDCSYRHLLPGHPDAIADRVRNGQLDKIPLYARAALARGGLPGMPLPHMPPYGTPMGGGMGGGIGGGLGGGLAGLAGLGGGLGGAMGGLGGGHMGGMGGGMGGEGPLTHGGLGHANMAVQMAQQLAQVQGMGAPHYAAGAWGGALHLQMAPHSPPGGMGQGQPGQPPQPQPPMAPLLGQGLPPQFQVPYGQHQGLGPLNFVPPPYYGASLSSPVPHAPAPGETRICFPFMNKGRCERGNMCRFRHLTPDHPDAIADRQRTGRGVGGGVASASVDAAVAAMGNMHLSGGADAHSGPLGDPFGMQPQ